MKIGWVVWDTVTLGVENASSRIRAFWVQKYMPDSEIITTEEQLLQMDGVIFQKRFTEQDVLWAMTLHTYGVPMIFDITDPEWDSNYIHYSKSKQQNLDTMIKLVDVVTVPTEYLARSCSKHYPHKKIVVIPDRIDLEMYPEVKNHKEHKEPFIIFWLGVHSNVDSIELAREDLEHLGKEFPIKLICSYGPIMDSRIPSFKNIKLGQTTWTEAKSTKLMLEADVSINPRFNDLRQYKSGNKTVKAHACGIPCVTKDFYNKIKPYLESCDRRNAVGASVRRSVETKYDCKLSVKEYLNLFKEIPRHEKKLAVVSCITGDVDNVIEEQATNNADFIMFTDNPKLKSKTWKIVQLPPAIFKDSRRQARMVKWLIHKFVPEYEYTLWIDSNVQLRTPVIELIRSYLYKNDIAVFKHKDRNCVYEEAKDCLLQKLDYDDIITEQMANYATEDYPKDNGLTETTVVLRRHTKEIEQFNEALWAELCLHSKRDQLCFDYMVWKLGLKVENFPGVLQRQDIKPDTSEHFIKIKHKKITRSVKE